MVHSVATAPDPREVGRTLRERCEADPDFFGRRILGRRRWDAQLELRCSVFEHRRTLVYSANGVGKTFDLGSDVCEWLVSKRGRRVICTGPTFEQVRRGLWAEVRKAYFGARARGADLGGVMGKHDWVLGDGWDASVLSVDNISAIQGLRGSEVLIAVDEAQGVDNYELWEALMSLLTAEGSRIVLSGNPLYPRGKFFEMTSDPDVNLIQIDGMDHPNVVEGREIFPGAITRTWIDERRKEWGEDSPQFQARVRGRFPTEGTWQVVGLGHLQKTENGTEGVKVPKVIGLDVARFGGDQNVLGVFDETRTLVHLEHWTGLDLMQTAGRCRQAMEAHAIEPTNVKVDACGMGAGVVDRLAEDNPRELGPKELGEPS